MKWILIAVFVALASAKVDESKSNKNKPDFEFRELEKVHDEKIEGSADNDDLYVYDDEDEESSGDYDDDDDFVARLIPDPVTPKEESSTTAPEHHHDIDDFKDDIHFAENDDKKDDDLYEYYSEYYEEDYYDDDDEDDYDEEEEEEKEDPKNEQDQIIEQIVKDIEKEDSTIVKVAEDERANIFEEAKLFFSSPYFYIMLGSALVTFVVVILAFLACQRSRAARQKKLVPFVISPGPAMNPIVKSYQRVPTTTKEFLDGQTAIVNEHAVNMEGESSSRKPLLT